MMKVLIVDDHAVVRQGLKSAIQSHGYEVVAEAGSINEAQAFMAQKNPDAIIVDINLPDGSGFDLVIWSRKVSPTTAIVVLTLNDGEDYVRAAKNAGASAFIVKSAPLSDLIAALDFAISAQPLLAANTFVFLESILGLAHEKLMFCTQLIMA